MTTDTPQNACPQCGKEHNPGRSCPNQYSEILADLRADYVAMTVRAEKAEAEVERLREQLERAVEIAEEALKGACGEWGCIGKSDEEDKLLAELDQLKATLNTTDK